MPSTVATTVATSTSRAPAVAVVEAPTAVRIVGVRLRRSSQLPPSRWARAFALSLLLLLMLLHHLVVVRLATREGIGAITGVHIVAASCSAALVVIVLAAIIIVVVTMVVSMVVVAKGS